MNFPSGGPGYPQQGGGAQPNPQPPGTGGFPQQHAPAQHHAPVATLSAANLTLLLSLAVTLLGLVNYFIGFSDEASPADGAITYLLIGGLLAALRVLPNGPKVLPFAALASVFGALWAILATVRTSVVPGVVTVILILGILQMLVAVATLLFEHGVLKIPTPQPQSYGQPYGQFGQPQQGPGGQQKAGPAGTQYGPPVTPPTPQSTVYAPQQGQFYAPPQPPESGKQESSGSGSEQS
ncbi:MAG TPA: DUF5336 domain-containing protein [Amycolatopsis sp.]|uniref:DUF5336 domain-containing protein n=1 Tax=Amycolatopsis sp. TaxID=37632 RepID=UPI002B4A851A|nr:DUF5336 domain-containing protein [Amycolatopsis sp.]HKS49458.1 DUF5336 domain-containing protein [Amycolatopsis sp.]